MNEYNDPKGHAGSLKTPLGLIPPSAMEQVAWAHKLGADKYGPWNWRKTGVCASTYVNAILRHLNAWRDGEDLDPESGFSHLAHIACSCNILMDASAVGKLQDDRNKLPTNGEVEEDSSIDGILQEWLDSARKDLEAYGFEIEQDQSDEDEEDSPVNGMTDEEFDRIIASLRGDLEDFGFELSIDDVPEPDTVPEYRILFADDRLQDGDEVYVGEGRWLTLYIESWATPAYVNNGTYRRKITKCDLKEKVADCDLKEEACDSNSEQQDMGECTCGRRYIYHWLYGWICEDCDIKYPDPYNS
jgi:hypothetical protein